MLKMVIADDDRLVLETLRDVVDWNAHGIEVVALAADGEEALRLCELHRPDILFTDIKMPVISGLEVAMTLREQGSEIKIIIISGVQDFDFARTALDIKVEGYILKPIQLDEVNRILRKTVNNISLEQNRDQMLSEMRQQLEEHHLEMKDAFVRNLVTGNYKTNEEIADKLKYFGLDFHPGSQAVAAVLAIDRYADAVNEKPEQDKYLLSYGVMKVLRELIEGGEFGYTTMLSENRFVMLLKTKLPASVSHADIGSEVIEKVKSFVKVSASIGIGNVASSLLELSYSYENACRMVSQKFYRGIGVVLSAEDIMQDGQADKLEYASGFSQLFRLRKSLLEELGNGDAKRQQECLRQLFALLVKEHVFGTEYVRSMCTELAATICHMVYELSNAGETKKIDPQRVINQILSAETVADMSLVIGEICEYYISQYTMQHQHRHSDLVGRIIRIIRERYMENLTIGMIADEVFVTQNYICLIFKREMGMTLNNYLTKVRMEKACSLLEETMLKVWQIAQMTGYENTHYFSTVFKKHMGMQPQQYRLFCLKNV